MSFQGEQNKQLQRNLNAAHVNFLLQSHACVEIITRLLMKDSRPMPDDLIIVCLQKHGAQRHMRMSRMKRMRACVYRVQYVLHCEIMYVG